MEVDQVANGKPVSTLKDTKLNKNLPFVERYRPSGLEDIISHTEIVQTIRKFIEGKTMPHLLFYGPPGTGKTSCMLAVAKEIYGP
jgi:replication factor C subunit 3/5